LVNHRSMKSSLHSARIHTEPLTCLPTYPPHGMRRP
jgi:hypothetical protein